MKYTSEQVTFERGKQTVEAYAGSVLSLLGVVSPLVRARTVGPENEDGHLEGVYPLTPLHWTVSSTRRRQLARGVMAEHHGTVADGTRIRAYAPKDLPNAGHNAAPIDELMQPYVKGGKPVVLWPHGDHLLAAEIPNHHLEAVTGEYFEWLSRYGRYGAFGAGLRYPDGSILSVAVLAIGSIPTNEVVPSIPAY